MKASSQIVIRRSIRETFSFTSQVAYWPCWVGHIVAASSNKSERRQVEVCSKLAWIPVTWTCFWRERSPPHRLTVSCQRRSIEVTASIGLKRLGPSKTDLNYSVELDLYAPHIALPWTEKILSSRLADDLRRLKSLLENTKPTPDVTEPAWS